MNGSSTDFTDAENLDALTKAVGLIVLQWGQAEQSLDLLVAMLWHSFNGKLHAKKIPMMLESKIKFVRACVSSDPALAPFQADSKELLTRFEALSSTRHDLIHGAVSSTAPVDNAYVFAKLDIRDGYHHHREVRIEAEAYPQLVGELVELGRQALSLALAVFEVVKSEAVHIK